MTTTCVRLAIILAALFSAYLLLPSMLKIVLRKRFCAATVKSGCKFITFDDGPDPSTTPQILDLLEIYGVRATFFVIGERAARYPDIVRCILARGHEIGDHGYHHLHPWTARPWCYVREVVSGWKAARVHRDVPKPAFFRPPYGKLNLLTCIYAVLAHRHLAFWDIDPHDYQAFEASRISEYVLKRLDSKSVVLFHDGRSVPPGTDSLKATLQAVALTLQAACPRMQFRTLSELLNSRERQV